MSYNGWTNYETWAVALWVDNSEDTYRARRSMADDYRAERVEPDDPKPIEEPTVQGFANAIREWVEEEMMPDLGASLASDLLNADLSEVNWREIAEEWLTE